MISLKFMLRGSQGAVGKTLSRIVLRINKDRKTVYYPTDHKVMPNLWNDDKEKVKSGIENHAFVNAELADLKSKAHRLSLEYQKKTGDEPSANELKELLDGGDPFDLISLMAKELVRAKDSDQYWVYKKLIQSRNKLVAFAESEKIPLDRVTPEFVEKYQNYLKSIGLANNTIINEMKRFRRLLRIGMENGFDLEGVYQKVKLPKSSGTHRTKLLADELGRLEAIKLNGKDDLVRDSFILAVLFGGMRFGDLATIRKSDINGDRLQYTMSKTGQKIDLGIGTKAKALIQKYRDEERDFILPILLETEDHLPQDEFALKMRVNSRNAYFNKRLVEILKKAEINKKVTFHCARHTAANSLVKLGVDISTAQSILGHSDIKITQVYLESLGQERDDAMKKLEAMW